MACVTNTTSLVPDVICTSMSSSPSSSLMALMPWTRGLEYCDSAVFLTVPFRVQNNRNSLSVNSRTGARSRACVVSGVTLMRFTIGLPRVLRAACGNSCTLSQ